MYVELFTYRITYYVVSPMVSLVRSMKDTHYALAPHGGDERMSAEATACGMFFALWWRYSHVQEKNRYDRYYASIKADADDDE